MRMREDGRDGKAACNSASYEFESFDWTIACTRTGALHIHEVRIGRLHKTLELVAALFVLSRGVEEVDGESLG